MTLQAASSRIRRHWQLYLVILPPIAYVITFAYIPMAGIQIAFKDFMYSKGVWASPWVGIRHFSMFFRSPSFQQTLWNTVSLSVYTLAAGFPLPIILAIALNESGSRAVKKTVQMVTYAPYFISTVVFVSMVMQLLDLRSGLANRILTVLGAQPINFMGIPGLFKSVYVWSGVWQHTGYSAIIYLAALSGIDPTLHEAAIIDGATKTQRIRHIDLPGIAPTVVILLILSSASVMNVGFEKVFLLQNPLNQRSSEVIATYVYKIGLVNGDYSFSTAIGLFNSAVNALLLVAVNAVAKRVGETSLW